MDWLRDLLGLPPADQGVHVGGGRYMMHSPIKQHAPGQGAPIGTDGWEPKGMSAAEVLGYIQQHNAPKQLMSHEPFMTHDKPLPYMNKPEWIRDPRRVKPSTPMYPLADEVWPTWTDTPNITGDNEGFLSELLRRKYITQRRVAGEDEQREMRRSQLQDILDDISTRQQMAPGQRARMLEMMMNRVYEPFRHPFDRKSGRPIPPKLEM